MNIKENSIWPNGIKKDNEKISKFYPLGENKIDISSIVWPNGDKIVTSMVYDNNKLVGYCDTKSMTTLGTDNIINLPYKHIDIDFSSIMEGTLTVESPNAIVKNIKWCEDITNSVPAGYLRLDFIESTGVQYIHTGKNATDQTCVEIEFGDIINESWAILVSTYNTGGPGYVVFAKGSQHTTYNVPRFDYNSSILVFPSYDVSNGKHSMRKEANRNFIDNVEVTSNTVAPTSVWSELVLLYFRYLGTYNQCKLYKYKKWELGQDIQQYFVPVLDSSGTPCMYDLVERKQINKTGTKDFIAGFNMLQAEQLGTFIPNNKTLTISLPWEANMIQYNSGVEESLKQAKEKNCTLAIRYRSHEECPEIYNKYAECETLDDMIKVNPNYKTDLSNDGEWLYPIPSMVNALDLFADSPMKKFSVILPETVSNHENLFLNSGLEGAVELNVYAGDGALRTYANRTNGVIERKITSAKINFYGGKCYCHSCFHTGWGSAYDTNLESVEILTHFEAPSNMNWDCLCDNCRGLKQFSTNVVGKVRYLVKGFNGCQLDKDSVLCVEKMLMTTVTSHQTVLGIHVDWKEDSEVLEAIDKIKTRVTNVYVQWNGTPTSGIMTLDLEGIYTKVVESEYGEYVTEDGVRCSLLWGHYVSDTTDHKLFFSLEEAEEYYKLRKAI